MNDIQFLFIVLTAMQAGKRIEEISALVNYSAGHASRLIKRLTGLHYKALYDVVYLFGLLNFWEDSESVKKLRCQNRNDYRRKKAFIDRHNTPKTIVSKEILMDNSTTKVMMMLAASKNRNVTRRDLKCSYATIKALRAAGIKIVSVSGPMGGYHIERRVEEHDINLSWVNNWRSAFGKPELSKLY